jgi:hypothetical protein
MRTHGLRGRYSPLNTATEEQKAEIARLRIEADLNGVGIFEVRYSTYIGPGCAAERGDITVCHDGRIAWMVMPSGQSY